jgi:hypothetical protein
MADHSVRGLSTHPTKRIVPDISSLIINKKGWSATKSNRVGTILAHCNIRVTAVAAAASVPSSFTLIKDL